MNTEHYEKCQKLMRKKQEVNSKINSWHVMNRHIMQPCSVRLDLKYGGIGTAKGGFIDVDTDKEKAIISVAFNSIIEELETQKTSLEKQWEEL